MRIVFDYNPNALDWNFENSEFAFVVISGDGNAQAVRYGPYNPAILGVYEGKLPEAAIVRLVDTARRIIPKASELAKPYVGSCDADSFQLSVSPPGSSVNPSKMSDFACLPAMSKDIRELVEEMRTVWKRLNRIPLAYGYLRSVQFFPLKSRELNLGGSQIANSRTSVTSSYATPASTHQGCTLSPSYNMSSFCH